MIDGLNVVYAQFKEKFKGEPKVMNRFADLNTSQQIEFLNFLASQNLDNLDVPTSMEYIAEAAKKETVSEVLTLDQIFKQIQIDVEAYAKKN
jgi:hypothetical protein